MPMFRPSLALFLALAIWASSCLTPSLPAADEPPVSVAEWRETCEAAEKALSPGAPDFPDKLWNWAEPLFEEAKAVGDGSVAREPGRIAFITWILLTSYVVQRQPTPPAGGNSESKTNWLQDIQTVTNSRLQADETFGAKVMRKSWDNFAAVCRERRWEMPPSPYEAPVKAP